MGHSLYNYALKYLKGAIVSVTFLAETVGSTILAAWLFREYPSQSFYLWGLVLIAAVITILYSNDLTPLHALSQRIDRLAVSSLVTFTFIYFFASSHFLYGILASSFIFTILVFSSGYLDKSLILDMFRKEVSS